MLYYRNVRVVQTTLSVANQLVSVVVCIGPTVDPLTGMTLAAASGGVPSVLVGDARRYEWKLCSGYPTRWCGWCDSNAGILASVTADPNCFRLSAPGFVPLFGGDNEDSSFAVGIRGDLDVMGGLSYDLSAVMGSNRTDYFIRNTVNASLGPNTPRDFVPGGQEQTETIYNLNFVKTVDAGLASDLNIAFGAEYREEEFDLFAGDEASYALGPLASQGFSSSSNGFGGFPNDTSASQDSASFYVDLEADVTEALTLQAAVRYEDYNIFGDTTNGKVAGIYRVNDNLRVRAARSMGSTHLPLVRRVSLT